MSRELLQQALPLLEKSYPTLARKLCDEIHEFLAAQPAPVPCARNELVTAIHSLASNFENSLYAFRDDTEARRKATGDIAHAMKIAAKHNQNGPGCSAAPVPPFDLNCTCGAVWEVRGKNVELVHTASAALSPYLHAEASITLEFTDDEVPK
jgi:hypothetical protein